MDVRDTGSEWPSARKRRRWFLHNQKKPRKKQADLHDEPVVFEGGAGVLENVEEDLAEEHLDLLLQLRLEVGQQGQEERQRQFGHFGDVRGSVAAQRHAQILQTPQKYRNMNQLKSKTKNLSDTMFS